MNPYASPQSDLETSLERFLRKQETFCLLVFVACELVLVTAVALIPLIWWWYGPLSVVMAWVTRQSLDDWLERRAERKQICNG